MPKFEFALSSTETIRDSGVVVTNDFARALTTIHEHAVIGAGDTLTIGVTGFPPVRYTCVALQPSGDGWVPVWKAHARAA